MKKMLWSTEFFDYVNLKKLLFSSKLILSLLNVLKIRLQKINILISQSTVCVLRFVFAIRKYVSKRISEKCLSNKLSVYGGKRFKKNNQPSL